jgi:hypothetical protein
VERISLAFIIFEHLAIAKGNYFGTIWEKNRIAYP